MPTPLELSEERPRGPCVGPPLLVTCRECGLLARLDLVLIAADEPLRCPRGHPIAVSDVPGVREVAAWVEAVLGGLNRSSTLAATEASGAHRTRCPRSPGAEPPT